MSTKLTRKESTARTYRIANWVLAEMDAYIDSIEEKGMSIKAQTIVNKGIVLFLKKMKKK